MMEESVSELRIPIAGRRKRESLYAGSVPEGLSRIREAAVPAWVPGTVNETRFFIDYGRTEVLSCEIYENG